MALADERIVLTDPSQRSNLVTHLLPYVFALPYIQGKFVLDLCCGTGYGTKLMAEAASGCLGVDYSKDAIQYASINRMANCSFIEGDVEEAAYNADVVTCFQGLEHLNDPKALIQKYKGKLFIYAVPAKEKLGRNEHHHHSITPKILIDWFGSHKIRYLVDNEGIFKDEPEYYENYFGVVQL